MPRRLPTVPVEASRTRAPARPRRASGREVSAELESLQHSTESRARARPRRDLKVKVPLGRYWYASLSEELSAAFPDLRHL
jgi:hypothetical protein